MNTMINLLGLAMPIRKASSLVLSVMFCLSFLFSGVVMASGGYIYQDEVITDHIVSIRTGSLPWNSGVQYPNMVFVDLGNGFSPNYSNPRIVLDGSVESKAMLGLLLQVMASGQPVSIKWDGYCYNGYCPARHIVGVSIVD